MARRLLLQLVSYCIVTLIRPIIFHQRANKRFMIESLPKKCVHLIELNDEFIPQQQCDGYLSVIERPDLRHPQLCLPWPVRRRGVFDTARFAENVKRLASAPEVDILLLGSGGTRSLPPILDFIANHPWTRGRSFRLHAYGEFEDVPGDSRIRLEKWVDTDCLDSSRFHAAMIYYDPAAYSDQRLQVGYPTKLATYVDWSLPVFSNRSNISGEMLGGFDLDAGTLEDPLHVVEYARHLEAIRSRTLPERYGRRLAAFIRNLSGELGERVGTDDR